MTTAEHADPTTLDLPSGIHAAVLGGRDVVTGEPLREVVLWADRTTGECPRCHQPIAREITRCPIHLNTGAGQGGALEPYSQQHGCGEWLSVASRELGSAPGAEDILAAAHDLATARADETTEKRSKIERHVRADLAAVLAGLDRRPAGGDDEDLTLAEIVESVCDDLFGRLHYGYAPVDPGVFVDGDQVGVWDWDPAGDGEVVIATALRDAR